MSTWLVFAGIGSAWTGMGSQLLDVPEFIAAIQRADRALFEMHQHQQATKAHQLLPIISVEDIMKTCTVIDGDVRLQFVCIVAMELALLEVLRAKAPTLVVDGVLGHSVGELSAAYAAGCISFDQTIKLACALGTCLATPPSQPCLKHSDAPHMTQAEPALMNCHGSAQHNGSSAEMSMIVFETTEDKCRELISNSPDIFVACINGPNNLTLVGPKQRLMPMAINATQEHGIITHVVDCGGIGFHNPHTMWYHAPSLTEAALAVLGHQSSGIPQSFHSSSNPQTSATERKAIEFNAMYVIHSLLAPVLFAKQLPLVPEGTQIIEVGPSALFHNVISSARPDLPQTLSLSSRTKDAKHVLQQSLRALCHQQQ
eukprot:m.336075 g.336075  ORF g.336075 m.336075 type:complete len:371 (-) comp16078_c0_seq2:6342-7454(-)